ncbi:MAG: tetratricopeptide repeat protein [Chloroflexaceae bacterium]|nr:tetratricopeptide repeat protein [Chloroflexaceae bacterium]
MRRFRTTGRWWSGPALMLVLAVILILGACGGKEGTRLGDELYEQGEFEQAIAAYATVIAEHPENAVAHNNLANAYLANRNYPGAIEHYSQALELDATFIRAYYNRGIAYYLTDNLDQAIADFDTAISRMPFYTEAYYSRGVAHARKGNTDQAMADFNKVLEITDDTAWREKAQAELDKLNP